MILVPFNTKLNEVTRDQLKALVRVTGAAGDREMIEKMMVSYCQANPAHFDKAVEFMKLLGTAPQPDAPDDPIAEPSVPIFRTLEYKGKPTVHMAEQQPGGEWKAACKLGTGEVDPETVKPGAPVAVDCKRCRNARKSVFQ